MRTRLALISILLGLTFAVCSCNRKEPSTTSHDLFSAASLGDLSEVKTLLQSGVPVNSKDARGQTALYYAIQSKNVELVRYLVQQGADINAKSSTDAPLTLAMDRALGDPQVALELINDGADVNIKDANGDTPLVKATADSSDEVFQALLAKHANPNAKGVNGITPLHQAAMNAMPDRVKLLLQHGANPMIADDQGVTPLDLIDARSADDAGKRASFAKVRAMLVGAMHQHRQ